MAWERKRELEEQACLRSRENKLGVWKGFEQKVSRIIFAWRVRYDPYEHFHFVFLVFLLFKSLSLSIVCWVLLSCSLYSVHTLVPLFSLSNDWNMVYLFFWVCCLSKYIKADCSSHQLAFRSSFMKTKFCLIISWVLALLYLFHSSCFCAQVLLGCGIALVCAPLLEKTLGYS